MLQPFNDRVLVEVLEETKDTDTFGLRVPDSAKDKPQTGRVVAAGRGVSTPNGIVPLQCSVGDIVYFTKFGGKDVIVDDKKMLMLHESEILGKFVDESAANITDDDIPY